MHFSESQNWLKSSFFILSNCLRSRFSDSHSRWMWIIQVSESALMQYHIGKNRLELKLNFSNHYLIKAQFIHIWSKHSSKHNSTFIPIPIFYFRIIQFKQNTHIKRNFPNVKYTIEPYQKTKVFSFWNSIFGEHRIHYDTRVLRKRIYQESDGIMKSLKCWNF